jgi:hypothetical protein
MGDPAAVFEPLDAGVVQMVQLEVSLVRWNATCRAREGCGFIAAWVNHASRRANHARERRNVDR